LSLSDGLLRLIMMPKHHALKFTSFVYLRILLYFNGIPHTKYKNLRSKFALQLIQKVLQLFGYHRVHYTKFRYLYY